MRNENARRGRDRRNRRPAPVEDDDVGVERRGEASAFEATADFTDVTADQNPDWMIDLNEEVIGAWRGESSRQGDVTLVWGTPLIRGARAATAELETLPAGIVFRSVGYRGVALPGVPFDEERGTIRNVGGRVLDEQGAPVPGVYAAGWIKRGPSGVIGTNKKDATETIGLLLEDDREGRLPRAGKTSADVDALLDERGIRRVVHEGWSSIDATERAAGEKLGRPRVKLVTWDDLLSCAEAMAAQSEALIPTLEP